MVPLDTSFYAFLNDLFYALPDVVWKFVVYAFGTTLMLLIFKTFRE